jgi:hypothetical protein
MRGIDSAAEYRVRSPITDRNVGATDDGSLPETQKGVRRLADL